jgi:hypothetical protein
MYKKPIWLSRQQIEEIGVVGVVVKEEPPGRKREVGYLLIWHIYDV